MGNKYVALKSGTVKTDHGVVCLESGDCFTYESEDVEKHIKAGRVKPLVDVLAEEHKKFKRVLHELELVIDEVKAKNPGFADTIQNAINAVETHHIKEDYKQMVSAVKWLKLLYLQAMRGNY